MGYDPSIALRIARTATVRSVQAARPGRLLSLDVFRGLVIVAMLLVNNIGDSSVVGYFWKHAGWIATSIAKDTWQWRRAFWAARGMAAKIWMLGQYPLLRHCTLADFVMPWFMLIIGVAIPFSVAAAIARSQPPGQMWLRTIRRALALVILGWILTNSIAYVNWHNSPDHATTKFTVSLGMDVLQLLGISYLVARVLYDLPTGSRFAVAMFLFLWHFAILKCYPQGDIPAGTFTQEHDAIGYIYSTWTIFQPIDLLGGFKASLRGAATMNFVGILSVAPVAATMLIGSLIGDWLRRTEISAPRKSGVLALAGVVLALVGYCWAFNIPFNKPRWSPSYLLYASGVGTVLLALIYYVTDVRGRAGWTRPLVVFGVNSIAAYFLSIMAKVWLLNLPRKGDTNLAGWTVAQLQSRLGSHIGSWAFTITFVLSWWLILDLMYRRRIFWKV